MGDAAGAKRVVIVDDSRTSRIVLRRILEGDAAMQVVGEAASSTEALAVIAALGPDVVTMDVGLGEGLDGVELTRSILAAQRTRVVIVSATTKQDTTLSFRALAAGALDVLAKPSGAESAEARRERERFVRAIVALAAVPLVGARSATSDPARPLTGRAAALGMPSGSIRRVLIGTSTGGPPLLASLFARLPVPLPIPVVIVQHISAGFGASFARWLSVATNHPTDFCEGRTRLANGVLHVAGDRGHVRLVAPDELDYGFRSIEKLSIPSVDVLFESAVNQDAGSTLAVLLTGMGDDGANGLVALRRAGASTVAQRPESCVVGSMPRSAIERGGAELVLDPEGLVALLSRLPTRPRSTPP